MSCLYGVKVSESDVFRDSVYTYFRERVCSSIVWFISLFILMKNTVDMHIYKYKYVYIRSINKWVCFLYV